MILLAINSDELASTIKCDNTHFEVKLIQFDAKINRTTFNRETYSIIATEISKSPRKDTHIRCGCRVMNFDKTNTNFKAISLIPI